MKDALELSLRDVDKFICTYLDYLDWEHICSPYWILHVRYPFLCDRCNASIELLPMVVVVVVVVVVVR